MKIDEMKNNKHRPLRLGERPSRELSAARAEDISMRALVFLAQDMGRAERFLLLTGIQPNDLRSLAGERSFQLALLDYLASDEPLLTQFAAEEGIEPSDVGAARHALGGGDRE
jgi:hypothetical protein